MGPFKDNLLKNFTDCFKTDYYRMHWSQNKLITTVFVSLFIRYQYTVGTTIGTTFSIIFFLVTGWTGENCDIDFDECKEKTNPCLHNGTCVNEVGGYSCKCLSGTSGNQQFY